MAAAAAAAMNYRTLVPWLGLLLVALSCASGVNSDGTLSFEAELSNMFDDGDMKDTIKKYLDLVPSSHRSRSGASRMMAECSCKSKKKISATMKGSGIHKNTGSYHNSLPDILDITLDKHQVTKDECECPACPPDLTKKACVECPKAPDCGSCPACPVPKFCQAARPGQKCPGPPKCQICIHTALGKSNETEPGPNGEPPGIIMSELAHLIIAEKEIKKMTESREYNASSVPALIARSPLPIPLPTPDEMDENDTEPAVNPTTSTKKPAKKPPKVKSQTPPKSATTKKPSPVSTTTKKAAAAKTTTTKAVRKPPANKKPAPSKVPSKKPAGTSKRPTAAAKPQKTSPGAPGKGMQFFSNRTSSTETMHKQNSDGSFSTTTTTTTTTTNVFSGMALFESNMNLIKNNTLREQILNIIDNVPENTGGSEGFMAKRILMRFGENTTTTTFHKRGHHRAFTFDTARHNVKSILGHMMEARRRSKCDCPKCPPKKECKKCEEPKPCPPKKCEPCRNDGFCPAPEGCPKHKLCQKCEPGDTDDPDYDGDKSEQDDVDSENPISQSEIKRIKNPGPITAPFNNKCGDAPLNPLSPGKSTGYMNGGEDEIYGEWPSFVRLDINMPDGTKGLCGGVLVSDGHVLTAGHCVKTPRDGDKDGKNIEAGSFTVHLADHKKNDKDKFEEMRKVKNICRSTKFNDPKGEGSRYDFALLTLDKNVTFNDHIQPACLPWQPIKLDSKKSQCYVVGLGVIKYHEDGNHQFADIVQKMRLQRASCRSWGFKHDDRSRWCWTKWSGKGDSCGGDSGGPILCLNHKRKWTIQGLVSYGSTACDGSEHSGWVGVYTRIPALLERMTTDCKL